VKIALTALWDGFGPAAKALAIGDELARRGHRVGLRLAASQAALCRQVDREAFALEIGDPGQRAGVRAWLRREGPDALVSVMAGPALDEARACGVRAVAVDSVAWRREAIPAAFAAAEAYVCQRFGDWPGPGTPNARLVGAIVESDKGLKPLVRPLVLIHLGGMSRFGVLSQDAGEWLARVLKACAALDGRVMVAGDARALGRLRPLWPDGARVGALTRAEYLAALAASSVLVTVAGLTSLLEAYAYRKPVVILPDPNPTHRANLIGLARGGLLVGTPPGGVEEALGEALSMTPQQATRRVARQDEIIGAWGVDGVAQVADIVEEVGGG
jgi:UDP:flavonoid glycosyltransferase YjiC (YdhE family)